MSECADYRNEAADYASRAPAEPATGDDITGADGALVISIPAAKYPAGKTATAQDTDLTATNIKDGVNLFGITGTFEGEGGLVINNIQTGEIAIGTRVWTEAAIAEIDPSKAFMIYNGFRQDETHMWGAPSIAIKDATHVHAYAHDAGTTIYYTVLEFTAGIKSVQREITAITDQTTPKDITITEVNLDKAFVSLLGQNFTDASASVQMDEWYGAYLLNSTTLRLIGTTPEINTQISWEVVELE